MRLAAALVALGGLIMAGALVYGFGWGGGWEEVRLLLGYPWFIVSLVDVYIGFALVAGWIGFRERPLPAVIWIVLLMTLGNVIACGYAATALLRARGNWRRFWMGRRVSA
jgi:hypothetical protein